MTKVVVGFLYEGVGRGDADEISFASWPVVVFLRDVKVTVQTVKPNRNTQTCNRQLVLYD